MGTVARGRPARTAGPCPESVDAGRSTMPMHRHVPRLLSLVAMVLAVLPMVAGGGETADRSHPPVLLARVDTVEITDIDLNRAAKKLGGTIAFPKTVEEWRARLQLLIDRPLLLQAARKRGFTTTRKWYGRSDGGSDPV